MRLRTKSEQEAYLDGFERCAECVKHYLSNEDKQKLECFLIAVKSGVEHKRKFEEIVVEYPSAELCTYPEYRGKPYFSIKYEENGEHIIGYGTYKPEVLSKYLQEYFIAPANIEVDKEASK